ncbi:hypothetical protein V8C26DRAFT_419550 [Trichoderma gracile]
MAPAPTPLSGCPLHRLEIRQGSTCTVYDAIQLESSLTATLEARRSTPKNTNQSDLMLQSHLGLRRVLSIQLADILPSSGHNPEVVSVNRTSLEMCINIYQNQQTVVFIFKESRDFNVAIYALKKFGLRVTDSALSSNHATTAGLTRSQSCSAPSSSYFGPRLSSFTPLQSHGNSQTPSQFSFTALLNSDVPLSQIQSMGAQYEPSQPPSPDSSQQPIQSVVPATHIQNPYQLYLSQHSNMYQPRVSSPLRYAVEVDSRDPSPMSPISPMPQHQPTLLVHPAVGGSILTHRSTSAPSTTPRSWQQPRYMGTDGCDSPYYQQSPPESQESIVTSAESDSQSTDGTDVSLPLQTGEDFRKLMPQPRNLPFLKEGRTRTTKLKPLKKTAKAELDSSGLKRKSSSLAGRDNRNTSNDDLNPCVQENASSTNSETIDASAAPIALHPISSQTSTSQIEAPSGDHSSPRELCVLPPMLIADNSLLEKINNATSRLLDQYTADVNRGCDGGACAQFYLDQIDMVRRDFWLRQLERDNCI